MACREACFLRRARPLRSGSVRVVRVARVIILVGQRRARQSRKLVTRERPFLKRDARREHPPRGALHAALLLDAVVLHGDQAVPVTRPYHWRQRPSRDRAFASDGAERRKGRRAEPTALLVERDRLEARRAVAQRDRDGGSLLGVPPNTQTSLGEHVVRDASVPPRARDARPGRGDFFTIIAEEVAHLLVHGHAVLDSVHQRRDSFGREGLSLASGRDAPQKDMRADRVGRLAVFGGRHDDGAVRQAGAEGPSYSKRPRRGLVVRLRESNCIHDIGA
mmetsp:Transcript_13218/g.38368  ORF Transcript_13218/g.38368 Transcript_13218/m.38368 type:complete len:277 (-) Transcript_13218:2233-3063(-)